VSFISIPLTVDPDQIADDAVTYLASAVPGWEVADGHLEAWLIEAIARMTSEAGLVAAEVPAQVFAAFGQQFLGIAQGVGTAAVGVTSWVVESTQGWSIPAGTLIAYRTSGDSEILYETAAVATVPVGSTSVTGVSVRAVEAGTAANGIPAGTELELVDALSYVTAVTVSSGTSGGTDAETDAAYLDRLATELQLLTPRPILPTDFAVLAQRVAGVHRALGVSGWDPVAETPDNERMVAVALVDADGAPVGSGVHTAAVAYLDGLREVNFIVQTMDPTYTTVDVTYSVRVADGYVEGDVLDQIDETLAGLLSPAIWGGGDESPPIWSTESAVVRYFSVSNVIAAVPGVAYVASLLVGGAAGDLTLSGVAPLPQPGTMTGTAV